MTSLAHRAASFAVVLERLPGDRGIVGVRGCMGYSESFVHENDASRAEDATAQALADLFPDATIDIVAVGGIGRATRYVVALCGEPLIGPEPYADAEARHARIVARLTEALRCDPETQDAEAVDNLILADAARLRAECARWQAFRDLATIRPAAQRYVDAHPLPGVRNAVMTNWLLVGLAALAEAPELGERSVADSARAGAGSWHARADRDALFDAAVALAERAGIDVPERLSVAEVVALLTRVADRLDEAVKARDALLLAIAAAAVCAGPQVDEPESVAHALALLRQMTDRLDEVRDEREDLRAQVQRRTDDAASLENVLDRVGAALGWRVEDETSEGAARRVVMERDAFARLARARQAHGAAEEHCNLEFGSIESQLLADAAIVEVRGATEVVRALGYDPDTCEPMGVESTREQFRQLDDGDTISYDEALSRLSSEA